MYDPSIFMVYERMLKGPWWRILFCPITLVLCQFKRLNLLCDWIFTPTINNSRGMLSIWCTYFGYSLFTSVDVDFLGVCLCWELLTQFFCSECLFQMYFCQQKSSLERSYEVQRESLRWGLVCVGRFQLCVFCECDIGWTWIPVVH